MIYPNIHDLSSVHLLLAKPGRSLLLRAGTLDQPEMVRPDVHIFTRSKLPWLELPAGARAFEAFYKIDEVWPPESLTRWRQLAAA